MSLPSNLHCLNAADEASFAEDVDTFDERLPIVEITNIEGLSQPKIETALVGQYMNERGHFPLGPQSGSFDISLHMTGHGSSTSGAISTTDLARHLGRCIGNTSSGQEGTTISGSTSATEFALTGGTVLSGGIIFVGALGDGDGEGQAYAVNNASTITVFNALAGQPVASQVVYCPELVYPYETADTLVTQRFEILTENGCFQAHGCWCSGITFSGLNTGEIPRVTTTMQVARWKTINGTFPETSLTTDAFVPAAVGAGSFFEQAHGTTTRNTLDIREFNLNIDLQTIPLMGPGGVTANQAIIGAVRTKCTASYDFVIDAEATNTHTYATLFTASSPAYRHAMYTLAPEPDGSRAAFYFRRATLVGERPTQFADGINRKRVSFRCDHGNVVTNDLTNSNFCIALG